MSIIGTLSSSSVKEMWAVICQDRRWKKLLTVLNWISVAQVRGHNDESCFARPNSRESDRAISTSSATVSFVFGALDVIVFSYTDFHTLMHVHAKPGRI